MPIHRMELVMETEDDQVIAVILERVMQVIDAEKNIKVSLLKRVVKHD